MKLLKKLLNFILGLILLLLIIALSIAFSAKRFVEKDLLVPAFKEMLNQGMEQSDLNEEEKKLVNELIKDEDSEKIIKRAVQNFKDYFTNKDYSLSKDDYELALNYILRYREEINTLEETDYSEQKIRELFNYEDANDMIKELFDGLYEGAEREDIDTVMNIYTKVTSTGIKTILFLAIVVVLVLITIVNWSFYKWLAITGTDLILSGLLFLSIFWLFYEAKTRLIQTTDESVIAVMDSVNLKGILLMAFMEITFGVLMIIGYNRTKKITNVEVSKTHRIF